jgi:polyisoprenoid-binding protein YceI
LKERVHKPCAAAATFSAVFKLFKLLQKQNFKVCNFYDFSHKFNFSKFKPARSTLTNMIESMKVGSKNTNLIENSLKRSNTNNKKKTKTVNFKTGDKKKCDGKHLKT